jgi:hypothetical protein
MSIYLSGTKTPNQIWANGDVQAVYIGDEKVWPDVEHGIEIELPSLGSDEWITWKQVLANLQDREPTQSSDGSWLNVVYAEVGGVKYYINKAPSGESALSLLGNTLSLNAEQFKKISTQLKEGATLTVKYIFNYPLAAQNLKVGEYHIYNVPVKGFMRGVLVYKNPSPVDADVNAWIDVEGMPSGVVVLSESIVTSAGATIPKGSYSSSWVQRGDAFTLNYIPGDWGIKIRMRLEGSEVDKNKIQTNSYYHFWQTYAEIQKLTLKVTGVF